VLFLSILRENIRRYGGRRRERENDNQNGYREVDLGIVMTQVMKTNPHVGRQHGTLRLPSPINHHNSVYKVLLPLFVLNLIIAYLILVSLQGLRQFLYLHL